jgi:formylglycine-generating enzyme required for sulfatase activity
MALTGPQFDLLQNAVLAGYDEASLRRLARVALGEQLDQIAGGANLTEQVFNLIEWSERAGRVAELIAAAGDQNPGNPALQQLLAVAAQWPVCRAAGWTVWAGRTYVYATRAVELAYLDRLLHDYRIWAQRYTPLAGMAEVAASVQAGSRLDLPLLFMPTGFAKLEEHGFGAQQRVERVAVDDLRAAVERYRRLVLLGEPGAGKTTTLWRLLYDVGVAAQSDPHAPLPVLAALGGYQGTESALEYVAQPAGDLGPHLPAYLQHGRAVLLLDALNEMPQRDYRGRVGRIQRLLDDFPQATTVVTCRALDYVETLSLAKLEVNPLDAPRQCTYLQRYLGEADGERLFWQLAGAPVAELWQSWQRAGGSFSEFWSADKMPDAVYQRTSRQQAQQWAALRAGNLPPLLALGMNPFMLVMLAQVYARRGGELPANRARLLAAFVDTLLERERARRQAAGEGWPGADTLCQALAQLAYAMQQAGERGSTAAARDWAMRQLGAASAAPEWTLYLAASASLLDTTGERVRFVHQLIQEYFAALAWQRQLASEADLASYWPDGWLTPSGWEETAILLAGLLPNMAPLVEQLLAVHPVLAARCLAESGGERPAVATVAQVQAHLVNITSRPNSPAPQRNAAANGLNYLGDSRRGVGLRSNGLPDLRWMAVPAGEFRMGSDKAADNLAFANEMPPQRLTLAAYRISQYPITQVQYAAFVQDGGYTERWRQCWSQAGWRWRGEQQITAPRRFGGDFDLPNHPVVGVSWAEATAFCRWLSEKLGQPVALPSEAQWEKAARGVDGRLWPWGNQPPTAELCNFSSNVGTTTSVGAYPAGASPYDCLDMAGNVWEWTSSLLKPYPYKAEDGREDATASGGRTLRGGSWINYDRFVRCAYRFDHYLDDWLVHVGFRVVSPGL